MYLDNISTELESLCNLEVRTPENMDLIALTCERQLSYERHVFHERIRPHAVEAGLRYFIEENPLYNIEI